MRWRLLAEAVLLAVGAPALAATPVDRGLVIDDVTVVDTATGRLVPRRAIVIADGHIVRLAAAGSLTITGAAQRFDGHGKFVVPGFLDMHAHPLGSVGEADKLDLMLANGVTGFRQMSGDAATLARRTAGTLIDAGRPTLLAMPGAILTPANAPTPAAAIAEIDRQKQQGADFIKVIDVAPPVFTAVVDEATRVGLPVAGHLPANIDARGPAASRMRSIEHLGPQDTLLLSCSSNEAALRAEVAANNAARPVLGGPTPPAVIARVLANPIAFTDAATFARWAKVIATFDAAKCRGLAAQLKRDGTWQVPTLIRLRTMELGDDPAYVNDPHLIYVAPQTRALWTSVAAQFAARATVETRATLADLLALQQRLVKLFDEAGVPMLAGSDLGGTWEVAGFDLHQEFDLLAEAGLAPLRVLQMTTRDGAAFMRRGDLGSVAPGRIADLVVLDGNPLADVANLHRIAAVVHNGQLHDRADLGATLAHVAAAYRAGVPPVDR